MPDIGFLPPVLKDVAVNYINHFSRNSVSYNSILSLGATGVENHTPDHPGWERIHGGKLIATYITLIQICDHFYFKIMRKNYMDVHIITFHEQPLGEVLMSIYKITNSVLK